MQNYSLGQYFIGVARYIVEFLIVLGFLSVFALFTAHQYQKQVKAQQAYIYAYQMELKYASNKDK